MEINPKIEGVNNQKKLSKIVENFPINFGKQKTRVLLAK